MFAVTKMTSGTWAVQSTLCHRAEIRVYKKYHILNASESLVYWKHITRSPCEVKNSAICWAGNSAMGNETVRVFAERGGVATVIEYISTQYFVTTFNWYTGADTMHSPTMTQRQNNHGSMYASLPTSCRWPSVYKPSCPPYDQQRTHFVKL